MHTLDFWFDLASPYSALGAFRVEGLCRAAGVPLDWKPFLLGPIFTAQLGIKDSPFNTQPIRGKYMFRDLERLGEKYGVELRRPTPFPQRSLLANRVACVARTHPWCGDFVRGVFRTEFTDGQDIGSPTVIELVLKSIGVDPGPVLAKAESDEVKKQLRDFTEQAASLGVFGAPNSIVNGELFFGQDRLEDAVAWAQRKG